MPFVQDDMKFWLNEEQVPASPKPWSSVDLPDLFLTNLMQDIDPSFQDDSLGDLSANQSTSESEGSPSAFHDFMLRHDSPTSSDAMTPPSLVPTPPPATQLGMTAMPMNIPTPVFGMPLAAACVEPALSMSPSHLMVSAEISPTPSSANAPNTSTATTSTVKAPAPTDEALLAPMFMKPGSNANVQSILTQWKSMPLPSHSSAPAKTSSVKSPAEPTYTRRTAPSQQMGGEDEAQSMWSRKSAHNAIERRYRSNINDRIAGLRDVVPALREMRPRTGRRKRRRGKAEAEELVDGVAAATKMSKATVLSKATEYICYLKSREVRLSRDLAVLEMLVRSLEGGEEMLAMWKTEMDELHQQHPPMDAVYGEGGPSGSSEGHADLGDEWDDNEADDADDDAASTSSGSADSERAAKVSRYMFGAFVGFSFLGGSADWSPDADARSFAPPSQARVVGASHQLWKRSWGASTEPHAYDHVPVWNLALEMARSLTLVLGLVALLLTLWYRWQWRRKQQRQQQVTELQKVVSAKALLSTPLDLAYETPLVSQKAAVRMYEDLRMHLHVPRSRSRLWLRLVMQSVGWLALQCPGVAHLLCQAYDPTVLRLLRRAWVVRAEMELSLGALVQPDLAHRLSTWLALKYYTALQRGTLDESMVQIITAYQLAQSSGMTWLALYADKLWCAAGASLVDTPMTNDKLPGRALAELLSIPLPLAAHYARNMPSRDDALVSLSCIGNLLDALRNKTLLTFWTSMLASMMRASGDALAITSPLEPRTLDVVLDIASYSSLKQQLATLAQERPLRSGPAAEQLLVAHGLLALVAGRVTVAQHYANVLSKQTITSLAAAQFVGLLTDAPLSTTSPIGPVDTLASLTLGWICLQRVQTMEDTSMRTTRLSKGLRHMQSLASQCLWTFVSPDKTKPVGKQLGSASTPVPLRPTPSLANALDTLMDHLSVLSAPV